MNNHESLYEEQIRREYDSANAGLHKFLKSESHNARANNASHNAFALQVKQHILGAIIEEVRATTQKVVGHNASQVSEILQSCIRADANGEFKSFFCVEEAAFLGLQLLLDTALNPNRIEGKEISKYGGDKKLQAKKTLTQLEREIGKVVQHQMSLRYIQNHFPAFFRRANEDARKADKDGMRSSTAYWSYNLNKSIRDYEQQLLEEGKLTDAELLGNRKLWGYRDNQVIGSLITQAVIKCCPYFEIVDDFRVGKKSKEVVLTELGTSTEKEIREFVGKYAHDVLPMLITPLPITNDGLGGWIQEVLQEQEHSHKGNIKLSPKHLEFINRQARVPFELNPFIFELMSQLIDTQLPLGKFSYQTLQEVPKLSAMLGVATVPVENGEQDKQMKAHPDYKAKKRELSLLKNRNKKAVKEGMTAYLIYEKAKKLVEDEEFYIPMSYDFRGRIYSRVPFVSFQSNDAGRYLIRFKEQTPIDDRTDYWLKIGIANAGGNDKLCWDERITWFENNKEDIINIGRMTTTGDWDRAYKFLSNDGIDDPFCLAALANEYVKVFVDKTQDFTQVYVCVDASCSGTSIFNAWRRNLHGAKMTNLVHTDKPEDIYLEVWHEISRLAPENSFRPRHIKKLLSNRLLRKMMKTVYVPASYASPDTEQKIKLKQFNATLKKKGLDFTADEIKLLQELWITALDNVSSIKTVVSWFHERTKEALAAGRDAITYTTCNGSVMTLKYPKTQMKQVRTLGYGSATYRQTANRTVLKQVDKQKMLNAVTANITHATDASALCEALWDCEHPFVGIHDACGVPPGKLLDNGIMRLKKGLMDACSHNVWDVFRNDNGLPIEPRNAAPVIGDFELTEILKSNYIFS